MTENTNNTPNSPYGAYGGGATPPVQPPVTPQSPYGVPHQQAQAQSPYTAPQTPPAPFQNPYQNNQQHSGHFPATPKPLVLETAYAFACFLWIVGAHKFYLRQTMQGVAYVGAWVAMIVLSAILGNFVGLLATVAIAVSAYGDIRTMKEQVERSNNGEVFPVSSQVYFIKKAFNKV